MIDKGRVDDGFIWNPSICECECDKSCDVGEYLDDANCKCRKRLIDKIVDKCGEDNDENGTTLNDCGRVCKCCTLHIVLLIIKFIIIIGISGASFYFYWYLIRDHIGTLSYYCSGLL